jgi:hypothetical protein
VDAAIEVDFNRLATGYMKELQRHIYLSKESVNLSSRKTLKALRDITESLVELYQHTLWQDVNIQTPQNLRNLVYKAEAAIE